MRDVQIGVITRSKNLANNFVVSAGMLEYWAYKKPVIVPDLEAFKEVIEDGSNGVFYKAENAEDLADKLESLYKSSESYNKMAMKGLRTANKLFNHKKIALDMVKSLESFSF
jgi:glycosyltransferase involved in cell wall biosynthesis